MSIGTKLKELRNEKGLMQKEVYTKLNIPNNTYSNYENDRRDPDYETLQKIAIFFDVSIDNILGIENTNYTIEAYFKGIKVWTENADPGLQIAIKKHLSNLLSRYKQLTEDTINKSMQYKMSRKPEYKNVEEYKIYFENSKEEYVSQAIKKDIEDLHLWIDQFDSYLRTYAFTSDIPIGYKQNIGFVDVENANNYLNNLHEFFSFGGEKLNDDAIIDIANQEYKKRNK